MLEFFWHKETTYLIGIVLALTAALMYLRPSERATTRRTLLLFLFALAGQAVSAIVYASGYATPAEVLRATFSVAAMIAAIRLCGFAVFRLALPALGAQSPRIVEDLVLTAAYVLYAIVEARQSGVDLSHIIATSAVVTAVVAFSMQDTLGNVLGGLALQFDNSIRVGDWIRIDDVTGRVVDIRWRSTAIETRDWETVVVPNSMLMKSKFKVLGQRHGQPLQWRRWIRFNIDPGVPPARIITIAESAVKDAVIANVALAPQPSCVLLGFEQGNLNYGLRYWLTDLGADDPTDSAVRTHLFTALQRAGLRIAEPQQTEHSIAENEHHAEAVRSREVKRRLHALKGVDLFATLTEDERRMVADHLQYAPFARGDVITRQGNISHWLYILISGEAEVSVEGDDKSRRSLGILRAGRFFGEMGVMTGTPRTATATAHTDVECYRLESSAFQELVLSRPALAEDISRIVASREAGLQEAQHDMLERSAVNKVSAYQELLQRVRRFVGLEP